MRALALAALALLAACGDAPDAPPAPASQEAEVVEWKCKQALIAAAEVVDTLPEKIAQADLETLKVAHDLAAQSATACEGASDKRLQQARTMRDALSHAISVREAINRRAPPSPPAAPPPPPPSPAEAPPAR